MYFLLHVNGFYCKHKEKKKKKININVVIIEKTGLFSKNKYIIIDRFYAISIRQIFLESSFLWYCFYGGDGAVYTYAYINGSLSVANEIYEFANPVI